MEEEIDIAFSRKAIGVKISKMPQPPTSKDPDNFEQRADEFLESLPNFGEELNLFAEDVNNFIPSFEDFVEKITEQSKDDISQLKKQSEDEIQKQKDEALKEIQSAKVIASGEIKNLANNTFLLSLNVLRKTRDIREDYERIGKKDYFASALGKKYVKLGEKINAKDCLILWHKIGIKTRVFSIGKPNIYTKGGGFLGYQEACLPDFDVITDVTGYDFTHASGSSRNKAFSGYVKNKMSDSNPIFKGRKVEVESNIFYEGIYIGNF